jgi:hypothetical protein
MVGVKWLSGHWWDELRPGSSAPPVKRRRSHFRHGHFSLSKTGIRRSSSKPSSRLLARLSTSSSSSRVCSSLESSVSYWSKFFFVLLSLSLIFVELAAIWPGVPFAQLDHDERCSSFDSVVCLGSDRKFLPEKDLEKNTHIRGEIGRRRDDGKGKFKH